MRAVSTLSTQIKQKDAQRQAIAKAMLTPANGTKQPIKIQQIPTGYSEVVEKEKAKIKKGKQQPGEHIAQYSQSSKSTVVRSK